MPEFSAAYPPPILVISKQANPQFVSTQLIFFRAVYRMTSHKSTKKQVLVVTPSGVAYLSTYDGYTSRSIFLGSVAHAVVEPPMLLMEIPKQPHSHLSFSLTDDQNHQACTLPYFVALLRYFSPHCVVDRDVKISDTPEVRLKRKGDESFNLLYAGVHAVVNPEAATHKPDFDPAGGLGESATPGEATPSKGRSLTEYPAVKDGAAGSAPGVKDKAKDGGRARAGSTNQPGKSDGGRPRFIADPLVAQRIKDAAAGTRAATRSALKPVACPKGHDHLALMAFVFARPVACDRPWDDASGAAGDAGDGPGADGADADPKHERLLTVAPTGTGVVWDKARAEATFRVSLTSAVTITACNRASIHCGVGPRGMHASWRVRFAVDNSQHLNELLRVLFHFNPALRVVDLSNVSDADKARAAAAAQAAEVQAASDVDARLGLLQRRFGDVATLSSQATTATAAAAAAAAAAAGAKPAPGDSWVSDEGDTGAIPPEQFLALAQLVGCICERQLEKHSRAASAAALGGIYESLAVTGAATRFGGRTPGASPSASPDRHLAAAAGGASSGDSAPRPRRFGEYAGW